MKRKARFEPGISEDEFSDSSTPPHINNYVDITMAVANYISSFVASPDFKQKDIAQKLDKHESEISKWLNGFHNLTLKSIIKLESVCAIRLLNPAIFISNSTAPGYTAKLSSSANIPSVVDGMYAQVEETCLTLKRSNDYIDIAITASCQNV